ncbi:hypothetical protein NXY05_20885 [Bacteroides fragilis]|nr:hypothetical protein [Bacteroides fragilis]
MLGSECYGKDPKGFSCVRFRAPTDDFALGTLTDNGEGKRTIDSSISQYRILSYFGRLNYEVSGGNIFIYQGYSVSDGYSPLLGKSVGDFPGVLCLWMEFLVKRTL